MYFSWINLLVFSLQLGTVDFLYADSGNTHDKEISPVEKQLATARVSAEKGEAQGQYDLGVMYFDGKGVKKDPKEAEKWFQKAAEQGHKEAKVAYSIVLFDRGAACYRGDEREPDIPEALKWLKKSLEYDNSMAKQAYTDLAYEYGKQLHVGWGNTKKNIAEALNWYGEAAKFGNMQAQLSLGAMYEFGDGSVKADYEEAAKWYEKAAEQGSSIAKREYPEVLTCIAFN